MKNILTFFITVTCIAAGHAQWTEPEPFPLEHGVAIRGPWISNDNLRMYGAFSGYIFVAERVHVDSAWAPFHSVGDHINEGQRQESPCESPTGDTLYFMAEGREPTFGWYDIYYTIRTDSGWIGPIINCGANINSEWIEWSVGISRDGSKLLICSDRIPGGTLNLYYSDKQEDGNWGPLVDFGPNVNTSRAEQHPTLSPDNTKLFFYTEGPNHGGIWVSQFGEVWQLAEPLPTPINTVTWTEADPCMAFDGRTLYFLSDVGSDQDFQIYSSVDTTVMAVEPRQSQSIGIEPTLFCQCDSGSQLTLTLAGVGRIEEAKVQVHNVLGQEIFQGNIHLQMTDVTARSKIQLPPALPTGIYVATVQINHLILSKQFQLIH